MNFWNSTCFTLQQNKDQMDEIQSKILQLQQLRKDMDGADGVDSQEMEDLQAGLDALDSQWTTLTDDIEAEDQRYYIQFGIFYWQYLFSFPPVVTQDQ